MNAITLHKGGQTQNLKGHFYPFRLFILNQSSSPTTLTGQVLEPFLTSCRWYTKHLFTRITIHKPASEADSQPQRIKLLQSPKAPNPYAWRITKKTNAITLVDSTTHTKSISKPYTSSLPHPNFFSRKSPLLSDDVGGRTSHITSEPVILPLPERDSSTALEPGDTAKLKVNRILNSSGSMLAIGFVWRILMGLCIQFKWIDDSLLWFLFTFGCTLLSLLRWRLHFLFGLMVCSEVNIQAELSGGWGFRFLEFIILLSIYIVWFLQSRISWKIYIGNQQQKPNLIILTTPELVYEFQNRIP